MTSGPPPSELPPELNLSPCNAKASLDAMGAEIFYEKTLTPSDANGSGRIVIPKAVAEMYFPFLENQAGIPLDAVDSMGNVYYFRFRFWINNQSRMYLLEGAAELQRRYNLRVYDVMIFAHKPDKSLVVAGRPRTETDTSRKSLPRKLPSGGASSKKEQKRSLSGYPHPAMPKRARRNPRDVQSGSSRRDLNTFLAPVDGVFRFFNSEGLDRSKVFPQAGVWTAVLDIKGEMYQAFFESQNDALTAFTAAGGYF